MKQALGKFLLPALLVSMIASTAIAAVSAGNDAKIIGAWTMSKTLPDGRSLSVWMRFSPDGKFAGNASIGSQRVWEYAGSWQIQGSELLYRYEQSSVPLPEVDKTDRDEIISVRANSMHVRSRKSGAEHILVRTD